MDFNLPVFIQTNVSQGFNLSGLLEAKDKAIR